MPTSVGDLLKENVLREQAVVSFDEFDEDTPFRTRTPALDWVRGFGIVLVVEAYTREVVVDAADSVVAATGVWTFANAAFTDADVGGSITVAGAANAGNDGTKTIVAVNSATEIETAITGLVDETFDPDDVTLTVEAGPLEASTSVDVSNDYVSSKLPGLDQVPSEGHWANVDDMFSPSPPDITEATSEFFQADPLDARTARINIIPTAGAGLVSMFFCAKGPK